MTQDKKYKILIAEDDRFIGRAYSEGFKAAGFDVTVALDGDEALAAIKESRPDLLLLDIIMPKRDGFELLKEMRLDPKLRDLPVVILSNLGQESDKQKALNLGCLDYLVKSDLSLNEVIDKVSYHLASQKTKE